MAEMTTSHRNAVATRCTHSRRTRLAGVLFLAAVCAACGGNGSTLDPSYIHVAVPTSPANFDPRIGTDASSARVHQLVYSPLLTIDENLRVAPGLAVRLENPDPLTYVAHLRSGVRFHDGHELTAKDVVYTFESFLDPNFVSA